MGPTTWGEIAEALHEMLLQHCVDPRSGRCNHAFVSSEVFAVSVAECLGWIDDDGRLVPWEKCPALPGHGMTVTP